jgi:hypothetical protein
MAYATIAMSSGLETNMGQNHVHCNVKLSCGVCTIVTEYNSSVRNRSFKLAGLSVLALSLVLTGCGQKEEKAEPPPPNSTGVPVTKNDLGTPADPSKPKLDVVEEERKALELSVKQGLKPLPPKSGRWVKSATPAQIVAKSAETRLSTLKNVQGEATAKVDIEGSVGMSVAKLAIDNPKLFYLEYPRIQTSPANLQKEVLVANGQSYATNALGTTGWSTMKPVASFRNEGKSEIRSWITDFPRALLSALQGGKPISNLLADAQKQGLQISVERQTILARGRQVVQDRLLIARKPEEVAKKGSLAYEIVVDDTFKLPVTLRASVKPPNRKETSVMWTIRWAQTTNKFNKSTFDIPAASKAAKAKPSKSIGKIVKA